MVMARRQCLLVFVCLGALAFAAKPPGPFGRDAIWVPSDEFIAEVHKSCDQLAAPKFGECMVGLAVKQAPAPAVAFARAVRNDGWMRDFREIGPVDIAYVSYPFRNQDQGWLFINGSSGIIDPDEIRRVSERDVRADRELNAYPKASLFPGDRTSIIDPVAVIYADKSTDFVVNYTVQDGCHACDVLGYAFFAWGFDAKGKFRGVRYLGFEKTSGAAAVPARPLHVRSGETFTLSLPWNNDAESDWGMEQRPSDAVLHVTGKVKEPDARAQLWRFAVRGTGTTQMILRQGDRPVALRITSAPALLAR
jgi:hypothetical protein